MHNALSWGTQEFAILDPGGVCIAFYEPVAQRPALPHGRRRIRKLKAFWCRGRLPSIHHQGYVGMALQPRGERPTGTPGAGRRAPRGLEGRAGEGRGHQECSGA